MRIVVDTNVLVSAALKDRPVPAVALHLAVQNGVLLNSPATEAQLLAVPARPYLATLIASATRGWIVGLLASAEVVAITERIIACRGPTDDKFLEVAVSGRAELIVSG